MRRPDHVDHIRDPGADESPRTEPRRLAIRRSASCTAHRAMDAVAHHDPGTRGRALVVDDDAEQRALLAHALDRAGFEVSTLHDGLELLELLRMAPPRHFQLVVTDQRMPGLHGTEVLARTGSRRTRFVIVSGYDTPQIRAQAEKYGAAAFVIKPFDIGAFVAMLDDILHEDAPQRADGSS